MPDVYFDKDRTRKYETCIRKLDRKTRDKVEEIVDQTLKSDPRPRGSRKIPNNDNAKERRQIIYDEVKIVYDIDDAVNVIDIVDISIIGED